MTMVEKCMCGNDLNLEWNDNEKFKMVRCSKCNNEIKFRNPNYFDKSNDIESQNVNNISEERLTKIIENVVGGNEPYWIEPVKKIVIKIIEMKDGTENSIGSLLGEDIHKFTSKQLFDIDKLVSDVCLQLKIKLDKSNYENQIEGLPYNIPFKKIDEK